MIALWKSRIETGNPTSPAHPISKLYPAHILPMSSAPEHNNDVFSAGSFILIRFHFL